MVIYASNGYCSSIVLVGLVMMLTMVMMMISGTRWDSETVIIESRGGVGCVCVCVCVWRGGGVMRKTTKSVTVTIAISGGRRKLRMVILTRQTNRQTDR